MPNYYGYELTHAAIQIAGSPALEEVDLLYANTIEFQADETTLTFEGDAQSRQVFITSGMTALIRPDCITVEAAETIFNKTPVTVGLPSGLARLTWYGDTTEAAGVTAGLIGEGYAIKEDGGVEEVVEIRLWMPLGTLTLSGPPQLQTKQKAGQQTYRLAANRATTDVNGTALPGVPTGGAFYAIAEKS